jgi:CBS domain-containing protein
MPASTDQWRAGDWAPALERAAVGDVMHAGIIACDPDATMTEVAGLMAGERVHCVAITTKVQDPGERLVWGIISDLDLVRTSVRAGVERTAREVAAQPLITVTPATALREAAELMLAYEVSHLVVVDGEWRRPVGVLSTLDIARALAPSAP